MVSSDLAAGDGELEAGLPEQQQEEEQPFLVRLHHRAHVAGGGAIDGTTTSDSAGSLSRIMRQTGTRRSCSWRSGRCAHARQGR
jgi:hypothetical protein